MHLNQNMSRACYQQNNPHVIDQVRIVVIEDSFPVISETFILDQITGLIDRGLNVENWALRYLDQGINHSKVIQYSLIEKTRYLALPDSALRHTPNAWVNELTRLNNLGDLSTINAFHVHFGTNFITFEPLFKVLDAFIVVSFYGYDASKYLIEHGDRCYDALFRRADLITTPTKCMMEELVRKGCPPDKITVHRCGVAIPKVPYKQMAGNNQLTMLSVARLVEKKGIEYALRALAKIGKGNIVKYRIIGDGPLKNELIELTKQLGLAEVVEFVGFISVEALLQEIAKADIIVLPSITAENGDQEGLPVTLVMAQALGLPVISSFHAGIPELVIDGVTGLLAPERDVQRLAQHMELLANDSELRQSLGAKGYERVCSEFNIEILNDKLADYLLRGIKKDWKLSAAGFECPICNEHFEAFLPFGVVQRENALCPVCHSLERHRLLWLFLQQKTNIFTAPHLKVLDIAPVPFLAERFKKMPNLQYLSIDINSPYAMLNMDITSLSLSDDYFDCILCYHVLEHIPDDRKAMRELYRVMKPGGWGILQVPLKPGLEKTIEDSAITDPQERLHLYGNEDHVRYYGLDYKDRLEFAGFKVVVDCFSKQFSDILKNYYGLPQDEDIYVSIKPVIKQIKCSSSVNSPFISILIPTYNRANYISDAIKSAITQSYDNFEVVVVDDGSTDTTASVVRSFSNPRLKYVIKEHSGAPATRNRCIAEARGEFVLWLDSDDVLLPGVLAAYAAALSKFSDIDVIYGDLIVTDHTLTSLKNEAFLDWYGRQDELIADMFRHNAVPNPGTMVRRSLYESIGGYNTEFRRAHDYEWWVRAVPHASFKHAGLAVVKWRWHDNNMSSGTVKIDTSFDARIVRSLIETYDLKQLFPHINWASLPQEQSEALAYAEIASRFVALKDTETAIHYAKEAVRLFPHKDIIRFSEGLESVIRSFKPCGALNNACANAATAKKTSHRLRILLVAHNFPPHWFAGVENYTYQLAQHLIQVGCDVSVLYPLDEPSAVQPSMVEGEYQGLRIFTLRSNHSLVEHSVLTSQVTNENEEKVFIGLLKKEKFDIVHFHHTLNLSFSYPVIAKQMGLKVCMTLHDFWPLCLSIHLYDQEAGKLCSGPENSAKCVECYLRRTGAKFTDDRALKLFGQMVLSRNNYALKMLNMIDVLVAPSRYLAAIYHQYGVQREIEVSALGLVPVARMPRQPRSEVVFGFLGNIHDLKNIYLLASAFKEVKGAAVLEYWGHGVNQYIERLMQEIGGDSRIRYRGRYTPEQLPEILSTIDMVVVPSLLENYPLVVREALSAGVPVIAAKVGGIPEIVSDNVNGVLIDPTDKEGLQRCIQSFVDNPQRIAQLAAGIGPVKTMEQDAQEWIQRYQSLVEKTPTVRVMHFQGKRTVAVFSLDKQEFACPQLRLLGPLGRLADTFDVRWGATVVNNNCTTDLDALQAADIIVVQRFYPRQGTLPFLEQMFATGKPIIYELDDLITAVPDDNHLKPWIKETADLLPALLPRFSAITVSTQELADVCKAYNPKVYVLPNLIDEQLWQASAKPVVEGPLVIGFAGTATHRGDLQALMPVLFRVAEKYGDSVAFRFMGDYAPECKLLPGFNYIPFAESYREYGAKLPLAGFDIAVVPLKDNAFNRAKSNIKWLEYSASGIAGVYADLPPYNGCIKHGETGLLAGNDPEQWFRAICLLVEDSALRQTVAVNARHEVLTKYSLCSGAVRWAQVYSEVQAAHGSTGLPQGNEIEKQSAAGAVLPTVSIIIPVFNQLQFTRQCLQALFATLPADIASEIIVVDNASSDGTSDYLSSLSDQVRVITNATNLGFAKACNQGARAAQGEYLLFLNNDTEPLAGWLEAMLCGAEQDGADIVGAKLLYPDGTVQHAGVVFNEEGLGMHIFKELASDSPPVNRKRAMQCVTAAAMLVRQPTFEQLNGFDELFLNGFEDVDFCLRAGKLGKKILYVPESVLIHHESRTEGRSKNEKTNLALFKARWSEQVVSDEISTYEAEELFGPIGISGRKRYQDILGCTETALSIYLKILERYPDDVGVLLNIAAILIARGRVADAQLFDNKAQQLMLKSTQQQLAISIIIPVFNQLHFTRQCLQALFATLPAEITSEIIVFNNASSDGTSDYLSSLSDRVRVITNATNLGFAKACNQGARAAQGEYLLFLNNDTVPQPGWLEPLLKAVQSGEADICGARLLYPDGRCQHAGIAFDERGLGYHIFGGFAGDAPEVLQRRRMQAVTGACLMISKQLFSELGGFDEGFLNGFEDVDLCLRAGELGKKILYQPESVVIHYAEQTPGRKDHDLPNMQRFFRRWSGKLRQDDQQLYRKFGLSCSKDREGRFRITREPDSAPQVSIIIPLFNQVPLTEACLSALQRFTPQGRYELILVDNGSTDGTPSLLEQWRQSATVIRNHENHGFARACNQGARAARGEYLLFLNNDTEVTDGWLEPLLKALKQDDSVAAVGSKLLYPDGTLQHAGVLLVDDRRQGDPLVGRHLYQRMPGNHPPAQVMRTLQGLTAACLLVRRQDFEAVGGFDEGYWNGYEDLDLCLKLAAAGKRLVYQPLSVVIHHESQSGPERFRQAAANIQRLHQRWLGKVQVDAIIQADGTIQHGPGMLNGTTAIYQPPVAQAVAQQEAQQDTTARQRRYQLVPLVAGSASSLVQRLSSSRRTRDVLQRYTVDA